LLVNSKVPNRQANDFSVPQSFCDGLKGLVNNGACLLAGKVSVLFELRVHEDTDQVCAGHISLLCPIHIIAVFSSNAKRQRFTANTRNDPVPALHQHCSVSPPEVRHLTF
jgi:hypothetical protein